MALCLSARYSRGVCLPDSSPRRHVAGVPFDDGGVGTDDMDGPGTFLAQLADVRGLWQREVSESAELRTALVAATASLAGAETKVSLYTDLLRCLISIHRARSRRAMCLAVTEHFHRLFSAGRVTLFLVDSRPGAGDGIDVGVGTVDEDEADVGTALDDGVTPGYDFTNEGGAGAVIWTAVSTSGDEFSVPLQPGPVLKMLQAPGVVSVRRPDVIGQYMRSMQRTQYAQGEVRELLACALRDGNGRVVGFLEALNHEEAMAEQGSEGFDDDDKALMRVTATHMGAAVSRYVMVCTCRRVDPLAHVPGSRLPQLWRPRVHCGGVGQAARATTGVGEHRHRRSRVHRRPDSQHPRPAHDAVGVCGSMAPRSSRSEHHLHVLDRRSCWRDCVEAPAAGVMPSVRGWWQLLMVAWGRLQLTVVPWHVRWLCCVASYMLDGDEGQLWSPSTDVLARVDEAASGHGSDDDLDTSGADHIDDANDRQYVLLVLCSLARCVCVGLHQQPRRGVLGL